MNRNDKIIIEGLKLFAYHGVNPEEKRDGQHFIIDLTAETNLDNAGKTDDLEKTVSYAKIIKTIKRVMAEDKYDLIERVAYRIIEQVFEEYEALKVITVRVKKPEAPISAEFSYVAVELTRTREEMK